MEKLKLGMKLYSRTYYDGGSRCWGTYKISKINPKSVGLKGYGWTISKEEIGKDYFTSKKKLMKHLIKKHKKNLRLAFAEEITPLKQEIRYLEKKLLKGEN